jgi:hypothetical protein
MIMKYILTAAAVFLIVCGIIYAGEDETRAKILLGSVNHGPAVDSLLIRKAEPGLALALALSGEYIIIPNHMRDSVAREIAREDRQPTLGLVAEKIDAEYIAFITISRLKNMLRADMALAEPGSDAHARRGVGYSLLHFKNESSGEYLYDPSILEALQRAFADALQRPKLYDSAEAKFRVYPAKTLVVGGMYFVDNEDMAKWELFDNKTINSYDMVESVFEAAVESPEYVVYDTDSRDSIYAMSNMYGVENYRSPTKYEIKALHKFEVDSYITGIFKRTLKGAHIELHLCDINNEVLNVTKSVKGEIHEDSITELRKRTKELARELLEID